MIYCILDGDKIYPSLSSNIKITRENPDLKDKGSYTLDVTLPMSIFENRRKFRNLNRIDVSLKGNEYESATLYVGNKAVISGVGVVTSVSNTEVKMQIMNANSEFKYVSGFDKKYIDDLLGKLNLSIFHSIPMNPPMLNPGSLMDFFLPTMINYCEAVKSQVCVGDLDRGIYTPIYDETNDVIINEIVKINGDSPLAMINPKCQFNLLYILKMALIYMGYSYDLSEIDKYPWNRIYIVNTGQFLPHWTVERLITEFKRLFGLSARFENRKATFSSIDYDAEAVSYECMDEFSSEYDDEGIQSNETSNLKYNLYDSSEKTFYTEIPDEVMEAFTVKEYESESDMYNSFSSLTDSEKMQSIFSTPTGYFYAKTNNGSDFTFVRAGQFNKLVRDPENDDAEELGIVPVTMVNKGIQFRCMHIRTEFWSVSISYPEQADLKFIMPTAESEDTSTYKNYTTVQQAIEEGESANSSARAESERMEVFFLSEHTKSFCLLDVGVTTAVVGTDPTIDAEFRDQISFALDKTPEGVVHIGQFHKKASRIDGKNQRCIKFICDEIPDPTRIYIFHNKRFVCEKIEMQITEKGIDQVKTGYFYEIVS